MGNNSVRKWCKDCDQHKPLDEFARNPNNKRDGRQPICQRCSHIKVMAWHAANQDRYPAVCVVCGKDFTSSRRKAKCCSRDCSTQQAATAAGERHTQAAVDRKVDKPCAHTDCTNVITSIDDTKYSRKYCTAACRDDAARHRAKARRSPLRAAVEDGDYMAMVAALRNAVAVEGPWQCWSYPKLDKNGYATVQWANTGLYRLVLEVKHGQPLGSQAAHHTCGNRACVNPEHLQPVTQAANTAEMLARRSYETYIAELRDALRQYAPDHPLLNVIAIGQVA